MYKSERGWFWAIHDITIVILSVLIMVLGLYYTIKVQIIEGWNQDKLIY